MISTALELAAREAAILAFLGALGSGAAALLPRELPLAARIALAPGFGAALGLGAGFTASQLMPMSTAVWAVLVPLALASAAIALVVILSAPSRPPLQPLAIAAVAVAVLVPALALNAPFADQHTPGPAGNSVADSAPYSGQAFALEHNSWNADSFDPRLDASVVAGNRLLRDFYRGPVFQAGVSPLEASLAELFGFELLDSQTALLAAFAVIGALGCFALVLSITGSALGGALAAVLFAGPVVYQLFIDSSLAPLAAMAMFGPLGLSGAELLRQPLRAGALFGIALAGVATAYPSFLPVVAVALLLGLATAALLRRGRPVLRVVLTALASIGVALVLVTPVGLVKDANYARAVADGRLERNFGEAITGTPMRSESFGRPHDAPRFIDTLPRWHVPASGIPSWLAGSRDIYYVPAAAEPSLPSWIAFGLLFPALLIGLAALGARSFPAAQALLPAALASALISAYAYWGQDCTYCAQRNLVPLAAIAAVLAAAGMVALGRWSAERRIPWRGAAVAALALVVLLVPLQRDSVLARRLTEGGTFYGAALRSVIDRAAAVRGRVALEGSGSATGPAGRIEAALFSAAAVQRLPRPAFIDWKSLPDYSYFPDDPPSLSDLRGGYRWVLTRLAGVRTPRRTVLRDGPYALQERTGPLDATLDSGVVTDLEQRDPSGRAWLDAGPLTVTVLSERPRRAAVRAVLRGPAAGSLRPGRGAVLIARRPGSVTICLPAAGTGPIRRATTTPRFRQGPPTPSGDSYGNVLVPAKSVRVAALRAAYGGCGR